jgi:chemotaxis response regulator CheB
VAAPARVHAVQTVALLGRADSALQSLRRALEELGAQVVFEGDPAGVQAEQVLRSGAHTVLVNLASGVEDDIDHLDTLFDDPNVNVVFNEGDVSSQLEGWDLARWARHLAAKVMGHERTIPPPPPGAELLPMRSYMPSPGAPPTPAQMAVQRPIEEFMIEAEDRADAVPSNHLPYVSGTKKAPVVEEPEPDFSIDVGEIEGALSQIGGTTAVEQIAVPEPVVPEILVHEDDAAEFDVGLDLAALDAALQIDTSQAPASGGKSDAALLDEALAGFNLDLDSISTDGDDGESITMESVSLSSDGLELDELSGGGLLDDDVAALAAQLDAMDAAAPRSQVQDLDFSDYSDKPDAGTESRTPAAPASEKAPQRAAPASTPAATPSAVAANVAKKPSFGALDLAPMSEDQAVAPPAPAVPKASGGYDFSKLNLSLEPAEDEPAATAAPAAPVAPAPKPPKAGGYDFSGLDLSLEAIEEEPASIASRAATAPAQAAPVEADGLDELFAAMDLAPSRPSAAPASTATSAVAAPGTLRRVIVLGASIGGPDALRSFLGGIPENFPALFVLAQHLENGFFERLAQQLQKSSRLPVRVPEAGQRGVPGEVLVIPGKQRVQLEQDGTLHMLEHDRLPKYTPCIDDVLRDVADTFGSNATAIIFSGMAGDAIEGAVYLTSQGGEVWAQDPSSCVVSSMVDGARARGVVEFVGSPRALAERCVAQYGNG